MSVFVDVVNSIVELSQQFQDFIKTGIYDLLVHWTGLLIKNLTVWLWEAKLALLAFSWDVAQDLIQTLNISQFINLAWSNLESRMLSMLVYFKIPEAINIIISAGVTKFVFRFIGF